MDQPLVPASKLPGVSSLLRESWHYYKAHLNRLVGIALRSWLVIAAATIVTIILGVPTTGVTRLSPLFSLVLLAYIIVLVIAATWQYVALIYALTPEGESKTAGEIYSQSKHWVWPYLLAAVISAILISLGFVLVIIPGIILMVWFCLAPFTVVLEGQSGVSALKASRNHVRGRFGEVLIRLIVLVLIAIAISIVAGIIGGLFGNTVKSLLNLAVTLFLTPFIAIYGFKLYQSVRSTPASTPGLANPVV